MGKLRFTKHQDTKSLYYGCIIMMMFFLFIMIPYSLLGIASSYYMHKREINFDQTSILINAEIGLVTKSRSRAPTLKITPYTVGLWFKHPETQEMTLQRTRITRGIRRHLKNGPDIIQIELRQHPIPTFISEKGQYLYPRLSDQNWATRLTGANMFDYYILFTIGYIILLTISVGCIYACISCIKDSKHNKFKKQKT